MGALSMTLRSPEGPVPALLVLGSNMGDRLGHLRGAVEALGLAGRIDAVSPVYESPPAGHVHQGPFLNLALRLMTALGPVRLLMWCKSLEFAAGRRPGIPYGPRPLDVDIVSLGRLVIENGRVSIPHDPRVTPRRTRCGRVRGVPEPWRQARRHRDAGSDSRFRIALPNRVTAGLRPSSTPRSGVPSRRTGREGLDSRVRGSIAWQELRLRAPGSSAGAGHRVVSRSLRITAPGPLCPACRRQALIEPLQLPRVAHRRGRQVQRRGVGAIAP